MNLSSMLAKLIPQSWIILPLFELFGIIPFSLYSALVTPIMGHPKSIHSLVIESFLNIFLINEIENNVALLVYVDEWATWHEI